MIMQQDEGKSLYLIRVKSHTGQTRYIVINGVRVTQHKLLDAALQFYDVAFEGAQLKGL